MKNFFTRNSILTVEMMELIHSMLICEIEAQDYLFTNAKKLNLSKSEVALTKHNLTKMGGI